MADTIPTSFITLYDAEVKAAYQREGSLLRKTVRQRSQVGGTRIYFPKIGKGQATTKGRNADVLPMNIETSRVFADMTDYYAPQYIDDLDQAKINWSLRTEYAKASAWALGRQTDQLIINAITANTNFSSAGTINGGGNTALTLPVMTAVQQQILQRDIPQDQKWWAVVTPQSLNDILNVQQATNLFYVREQLLINGEKPTFWMGFNWIVHTGLPATVNGATFKGMFYHELSVGHGINVDIRTMVDWVPQKVAWLVNSAMSMGSTVIENDGIQLLTV